MSGTDSVTIKDSVSPELQANLKMLFEKKLNPAMRMYLETCTRCGNCIKACHVYASMPEIKYTAVARDELVRKIFKRYFKLQGRFAPWLGEVLEFDDDTLVRLNEAAYTCTGCRRCMMNCPFGIDTQQIMGIAKALLIGADRAPEILEMLADMSVAKGETAAEAQPAFAEALNNLEPDVQKLWPRASRKTPDGKIIPFGVKGARVLYVALSGAHSIVPAAALMNAADESWTLSAFEAVNFGAFLGDSEKMAKISSRVIDEARSLGVEEVAIVECGTAYRVMKQMVGPQPFKVAAFVELIARYLREGRIRLSPDRIKGKITYHDPCQIGRNGGIFEEPREVIRALSQDFVELVPNRAENWCCGGGGGLVAMGEKEFRMKSAKVKAEQLRASGAAIVTTACENCHSQLCDINEYYGLGMQVESLAKLAAEELVKPEQL